MTDNKRATELTIRVKEIGTKTFKEVASSVGQITEALDRQVVAAERGEVSVTSLKETIRKLKEANQDLVKQQAAVDFYEDLAKQLGVAEKKALDSRAAFEALATTLAGGAAATKKQEGALVSLEKKANGAEASVVSVSQKLEAQRERLQALGLDTNNLVQAQQNLVTVNTAVERSLKAVSSSLDNYDANILRTKAAEEALATAQRERATTALAAASRGDLGPLQAITDSLERQKVATEALAAVEQRRAAADRAKNVRADLAFQQQLEDALERQKVAQARLAAQAELNGFQQIGSDAIEAAGKLDVYSAAATRAAPATSRIAHSLTEILNPAAATVRTLGGLEAEISRVTKVIGDGKGSVHEYSEAFTDLDRVQRQVLRTAGDLDAYKDQARAVAQAQAAFEAAKADVLAYANAVKQAEAPNEALAADLRTAETALARAETALTSQITKLREYGRVLKVAEVDVNDLAAAEKKLARVANDTAAATAKLTSAASGKNGKIGTFLGLKPYELQNLSFQINDVFTQIASGTSITQTFAQQGGQFVQLFPKLFASLIPLAPIIAAVGLAVGLVFSSLRQIFDLEASQRQFNAQLALGADAAQINTEALAETAHELDVYGASLKDVRKEIAIFLKEGLDPSRIQEFGQAAQDLAVITGQKVPEAAKELADGFTGGMEAVDKLDEAYNFLTATQREHAKALFDAGRAEEARNEVFEIFRKNARDGANEMRDDLGVAVQNLTVAWDGFLHTIGNILPIQETADVIAGLTKVLRDLTGQIPKARAAADGAKAGAAPAIKKDTFDPSATTNKLKGLGPTGTIVGSIVDGLRARGRAAKKEQEDQIKQTAKAAGASNKILDDTSERAKKTNDKVIEGLKETYRHTKDLTAAERIRLAGMKAVREASEKGATGNALSEAKKIGEEFARQEIAKEDARKKSAADRNAGAAARKAESEENRRLATQATLAGQLRQIQIKVDRDQVASLEDRLESIDAEYEKIFETIEKLKKQGGTTARGKSFADFTAEVEAGKEILKQNESLKFYAESINAIEKQRSERLETIKDQVAAGNVTAAEGFEQARAVVEDLDPKIAEVASGALLFAEAIKGAKPDPKLEAFIDKMQRLSGANEKRSNSPLAKTGQGLFDEQKRQLDTIVTARDKVVENERRLVDLGLRAQTDAQANIRAAYGRTTDQIVTQTAALATLAKTLLENKAISDITYDGLITDLELIRQGTVHVDENFTLIKGTIEGGLVSGFQSLFDTAAEGLARVINGTGSWEDALKSLGNAALSFVASFLKGLSDVLLQIAVLQAIKNIPFLSNMTTGIMDFAGLTTGATALTVPATALNTAAAGLNAAAPTLSVAGTTLSLAATGFNTAAPLLAPIGPTILAAATALSAAAAQLQVAATLLLAANAASAGVLHSGGVVGQGFNRTRSVPAALFAGAPRYHSGTVVGLKHDEQTAILQDGEEVLDKGNPRNILNGGAAARGKGGLAAAVGLRQILAIGDDEIANAMSGAAGDEVFLTKVRRFKSTIKKMLS